MVKQLELFPELATRLASNLDEEAFIYARSKYPLREDSAVTEMVIEQAYKDGASRVFTELIDLLKKYTDLHES